MNLKESMNIIVVGVCIKSPNNEILMVQEARKDIENMWNFPSGKLQKGEIIFEGAIREAKEETGLNVKLNSILYIDELYNEKVGNIMKIIFNADIVSGEIKFDKNVIKDVRWIPIDKLLNMTPKELRSYDSHMKIIQAAKENKYYPLDIIQNKNI